MKVIFLGTPDFAVNALEAIINSKHKVVGVVTQPDKPVGRSGQLQFSPVKKCAISHEIPVFQYDKISREGLIDLKKLNADVMVTCAYGQMLSKEILEICPKGVFNIHASLLPKYRGASPIQHAILNGDKETGVSIMKTEVSMDSGDLVLVNKVEILPDETAGELFDRLAYLGAKSIVEALDLIEQNKEVYTPQNHDLATFVKQLKKSDGEIDFTKSCFELDCFVRGMNPWPCAFTFLNDKILKIFSVKKADISEDFNEFACGQVITADSKKGLIIKCGDGGIEICQLQLEGSKRMDAKSFLLGRKINIGDKLGKC